MRAREAAAQRIRFRSVSTDAGAENRCDDAAVEVEARMVWLSVSATVELRRRRASPSGACKLGQLLQVRRRPSSLLAVPAMW